MARSALSRIVPAVFGAALLCSGLIGCASKEDLTALKMDRDNLAEQLAAVTAESERNKQMAAGYREQIANGNLGSEAEAAQIENFRNQVAQLTAERDELMGKYQSLLEKIGTGPALPPVLTHELTAFADANRDYLSFDAQGGIVKFKSDVTFASGDAELTADAKGVIGKFASILNGPIAKNYRLEIAGHTDNVPVSSGLTKSKGHKDNWFLSSHRAISVAQALMSQGITQQRIGVTGYADQRPVASNTDAGGRQQNRRVEVLILPTTVTAPQPAPTAEKPTTPDAETAGAAADEAVSK